MFDELYWERYFQRCFPWSLKCSREDAETKPEPVCAICGINYGSLYPIGEDQLCPMCREYNAATQLPA